MNYKKKVSDSKSSMLLIDLNIFSNETSSSRMSYRRQKRWWNAYILFYERIDENSEIEKLELTKSLQDLTIGKILLLGLMLKLTTHLDSQIIMVRNF